MIKTESILLNTRVVQLEGNIVSDMGGEKVMMNIQKGKYYNLGTTGGTIWELIKTPREVSGLIKELISTFEVDEMECKEQVISFLEMLNKEGLVKIID
jgi:hypothetical protein